MITRTGPVLTALQTRLAETSLGAYLALVAGVTCIGFSAIFTRWGHAPGVVVATWRVGIATLVLAVPFMRQPAAARRISRKMLTGAVLGGLFFGMDVGIWNASLDYTPAANATFMTNTAPLWVGLFSLFVLKEKLPRLFWPGMVLALGGAALMVFSNGGNVAVRQGDLMALTASFFWAAYQLVTARTRTHTRMSNLSYLWLMVATSTALLAPVSLLSGFALAGYDAQSTLAMLGAGLISQVGGYLGINYALGKLPASRVSVVMLLQPVITAIAAVVLLGESLGSAVLVGCLFILAGIYMVTAPTRTGRMRCEN